MQLSGDAALALAVDSSDRVIVQKVEFDWNHDGLYNHVWSNVSAVTDSISIERSLMGVLPEECTVVEGFQAAKMTLQLSGSIPGNTLDIAQVLSPYRTDSPLYPPFWFVSTPVRVHLTVRKADGTETPVPQFLGKITEVSVNAANRTVTVTCLDGAEDCRKPITFPVAGMSTWQTLVGADSPFWWHNTQWAIDYVLRKCGYYQSPPADTDSILYSATGHGSPIPEIGHSFKLSSRQGPQPTPDECSVPGVYGLAVNGTSKFCATWNASTAQTFNPASGDTNEWSIQFLAKFGAGTPVFSVSSQNLIIMSSAGLLASTSLVIRLNPITGQVFLDFSGPGIAGTVNGPTYATDQWNNIAVKVKFNSLTDAVVTWRGQAPATVNLAAMGVPASPSVNFLGARVSVTYAVPMQCIQIKKSAGTVTWYDTATFVPNSTLDPGLNSFISLPEVRAEEGWEILKQVASSEFGVVGFDESGKAFFRNRDAVRRASLTVHKTITDLTSLKDLTLSTRSESVRNVIVTPVQPRWEVGLETIWDIEDLPDGEWFITSGEHGFTADIETPFRLDVGNVRTLTNYTTAQWDAVDRTSGFVAINAATNAEVAATVLVWQQVATPYQLGFYVVNPISDPIKFRTTNGDLALRVDGYPYQTMPEKISTTRRDSSVALYGERPYQFSQNPYAQSMTPMAGVVQSLLKDLKRPVPILERIPIVGDPRVQLTDTVQIEDLNGVGGPITAVVSGITRTFSEGVLDDSLTPRSIGAPGAWILGHPQKSILGSTTIPG